MPSFDVVSEVDRQEVRNAVDQAQREIATRFDFKNTNSSIELNELAMTLHTSSRDRLAALRTVLEVRGLVVDEQTQARISACSHADELRELIARAATVTSAEQLFTRND